MKIKYLLTTALALGASFALGGCYTILQDPHSAADLHESEWAADDEYERDARMGRFDDEDDDFYRYPGVPSSYGGYGGYSYPIIGGGYGGYGYGGYGYGGYPTPYGGYGYGGYGPYSYGYDPYYTDSRGFYVPPGYELVSTRELDTMRASLANAAKAPQVDERALREEQRRREEVWGKRVEPRVRRAPTPTPRSTSAVSAPPATSSPTPSTYAAPPPPPASKTSSGKASAKPKKRRR